jgi:pyridoxal phosphate enzyme (YggS family)
MTSTADQIAQNHQSIVQRVGDAARRAGRDSDAVRVIAVTKYVGIDLIELLIECGCTELGESRPQQLWDKANQIEANVCWHMIGHLQRNKVDRTLPLIGYLHSIDSTRLLKAVDTSAGKQNLPPVPALLEINISSDAAKHGFTSENVYDALQVLSGLSNVKVYGLMGMASFVQEERIVRSQFALLRALGDRLRKEMPAGHTMAELSMGMSGDFEIAIEEGATMVRIGSAFFEGCGE